MNNIFRHHNPMVGIGSLLSLLAMVMLLLTFSSCNKDEGEYFSEPFIRIATETGASRPVVKSGVKNVNTYYIYLSSTPLSANLEVNYEVKVGNGLQPGVDFELVNKTNALTFLPGIYNMPIRIRWMPHRLDPDKDNTITITLVSNSMNLTMGYPGPDHLQRELVIEKQN